MTARLRPTPARSSSSCTRTRTRHFGEASVSNNRYIFLIQHLNLVVAVCRCCTGPVLTRSPGCWCWMVARPGISRYIYTHIKISTHIFKYLHISTNIYTYQQISTGEMISGFVPSQLKEARLLANFRFIYATPTGAGGNTSNLRQALIWTIFTNNNFVHIMPDEG